MAQTKRKRRSKHRGNAAGSVQARGRTGRPSTAQERKAATNAGGKGTRTRDRTPRAPTWKAAAIRAALTSLFLPPVLIFLLKSPVVDALVLGVLAFVIYIPLSYYTDLFVYRRRQRRESDPRVR